MAETQRVVFLVALVGVLSVSAAVGNVGAQSEITEEFNETYGSEIGGDRASSVVQTSDEGYVLAGSTRSFGSGSSDAWFIKKDRL